jgi:hypothetical protein
MRVPVGPPLEMDSGRGQPAKVGNDFAQKFERETLSVP